MKKHEVQVRIGFLDQQRKQLENNLVLTSKMEELSLGSFTRGVERLWPNDGEGHTAAVSNGTIALELIWNVLECDHVIVPEMTVPMVKWAIKRRLSGRGPTNDQVEVEEIDVDSTHCMDLELAKEAALKALNAGKNVGICYVATGGLCSENLHEWIKEMRQLGAKVVVDMSHAHGVLLGGYPLYTHANAASWSFYATKVLTSGEGGAAWFASLTQAELARTLANQGKKRGTGTFLMEGLNARMSEFTAAALLQEMTSSADVYDARRSIAAAYDNAGIPGVHLNVKGLRTTFYKYVVPVGATRFGRDSADVVEKAFSEQGVRCAGRVHGFADNGGKPWKGENARKLAKNHVCLPVGRLMSQADVEAVIAAWQNVKNA